MKQFSKDLGNVSLAPKGRWSKEQEYERLNLVYNACDNLSYVAKINVPIGVEIDNREYWQPMNATGYADNNFINLTAENENGTITAYETLEEAVATILPINRRAGATLSFYNLNSDRLDRQAEFELWQFNSTDLANWEIRDYWNNIYYNWNVFAGWYVGADGLKNHVKIPNVGQYAYVGTNLNDAILYQCRTNGTWTNTGIKVRNYISVVVSGNITIGENGNWFSDGKDTGIPATPAVDEQLDNIIMQLQQHTTEINNLKSSDANLQDQITSNDSDITNLNAKHESLSRTVQGIAATGGASTANNVTYNNDSSGLNAENAQDAIDEVSSIGYFAKRGGIVNISTNYNSINTAEVLTLAQAIAKVPSEDRVLGFQGKFLTENGWVTYQFNGYSISNWNNQDYWSPILDSNNLLSGLGDDSKHTISQIGISRAILQSQGLDGSRYTGSAFYAYSEAIKFIAFLPKEGEEDHEFSIYALTTHGNSSLEAPSTSSINLWILDDTLSKAAGSEVNAAQYAIVGDDNILDKIQFIKQSGYHGTLYAIIDWNPIYNYKNSDGLYAPVIWSTNFSNPTTVKVQKVSKDDPRIINWNDLVVRAEDLVNEFGVDTTKILDQKTISSLFGVGNGLSFYYNERADFELKAMRIIKKLYFSSFESEPKEMGIGVLGSNGGDLNNFWFGLGYLDGTSKSQEWITIDFIPVNSLPKGVESFYVEKAGFGKMYVEIDFDAYRELGNAVWSFSNPICKVTNILSVDDMIWDSLNPSILISNLESSNLRLDSTNLELSTQAGSGYINNSNGNIVTGIWNYFVYKCDPSDIIEVRINISGGAIGSNVCAIYAIYNSIDDISSDTLISKGPQWDAEATSFYQRINIPSTAKCIVFCAQKISNLTVIRRSISILRDYTSTLKNYKYVLNNLNGSFINEDLKQAIVDARLILDDESKHLEFWSGSHSFEKNEEESYTSPQRLWGCCQATGSYMNWYWMYPSGDYVPWNSSFSFTRGEGKTIKDGIEYFVKSVTLDGYNAKLHFVINWEYVPNESAVFKGNYLDNSIISTPHDGIIQNLLFTSDLELMSPTQFSDMTKLNFGVDGDSITEGNQWSYYVTQYLGFANHHNVGVGSATWACKKQTLGDVTYQTQEYDAEDFAGISSGWESTTDPVEIQKRCNNCAKVHVQKFIDEVTKGTYPEPDVFAFAMGTNDSDKTAADGVIATGTNYPSGDMLFTLAGAMKWCIQKIHETYPNCKIFILLPIQRYTGGNENNLQKIEIMKNIAKAFSVEVIDMYSNCGISSMLETGTGPYLRDGLHPNTAGQKLMGKYAASQIRNYIY